MGRWPLCLGVKSIEVFDDFLGVDLEALDGADHKTVAAVA